MVERSQRSLLFRRQLKRAMFAAIAFLHAGLQIASATETFNVASKTAAGPSLTLYLPTGWTMAKPEESDSLDNQFLFEAPNDKSTYIFCRIEKCDSATGLQKLKSAYDAEHRQFLDEFEENTSYFDMRRFVAWQRAFSKGNVVVSVTFFGEALYHLKFFVPRKEFAASKRVLELIVDKVEVHGVTPQLTGVSPQKKDPLSEAEINTLFDETEHPSYAKYCWMIFIAIVMVSLFFVERTIRLRRHREEMAELDKQIAERKASAKKVINTRDLLNDADVYTKSDIGKRR